MASKPTNKELTEKYRPAVEASTCFMMRSIENVNHRPHPFMIGTKHVAYAADNNGGMLTEDVCEKIPCAHPGCHKPLSAHTSDKVMFLTFTKDTTQDEAKVELQKLIAAGIEADGIDGFAFVESEEGFKVI